MEPLHTAGGAAVLIAGLWFAAGYVVGLFAGRKLGDVTLWPSIVVGVACCLIRGYSEPLEFNAVAAVSVLHVAIGCLTILILKHARPASS
jgi:hypothetical protein